MSSKKFGFEKNILGARLKQIRDGKNLTQQEFARVLITSAGFISEIESGKRAPGSEFLFSLSRVFEINIHWLLTGEGDIFTKPLEPEDIAGNDSLLLKILNLLKDMDEERKKDILRYIEKEKLLMKLLEQDKK